jgi:hypothetical protein
MKRQAILDDTPAPLLWALTTESVLEWPIGGAQVMRKQLAHLLEMSERPNIGIRVIPKVTGAYPGIDGSFSIISSDIGDVATPTLREAVGSYPRRSKCSRMRCVMTA